MNHTYTELMSTGDTNANNCKLIQCGACFRSFHTQAQFGQHSRICREGKAVIRHLIRTEEYKYSFIEKQTKRKLEVKSRFVVDVKDPENWKKISRQNGLFDGAIKKMLIMKQIHNVDIAVRQRKASGLIVANFLVRNVPQNANAIHNAKASIERAVDAVYAQLPDDIEMRLHLCTAAECNELVIRDTEGFCSRHRAQKYHKKSQQNRDNLLKVSMEQSAKEKVIKNNLEQEQFTNSNNNKEDKQFSKLLNHLKATAPLSPISSDCTIMPPKTEHEESKQQNVVTTNKKVLKRAIKNIKNEEAKTNNVQHNVQQNVQSEDDLIVAQILTNLRRQYGNFEGVQSQNQPQVHCPTTSNSLLSTENSQVRTSQSLCCNGNGTPPYKKRRLQDVNNCAYSIHNEWNSEVAPSQPYFIVPVPMNSTQVPTVNPIPPIPTIQFVPVMNVSNYNNVINCNYVNNNNQMSQLQAIIDLLQESDKNNQNMPNLPPLPPINGTFQFQPPK